MNILGKLSQSSLATCILGTTPALYCTGRIVGVNLLRQYTTTVTKPKTRGNSSKSTQQKKKEKEKATPIPEEPKKPSTAYTIFYRDFYHEKHQNNPEYKVTEIAKLAGAKWLKLPAEEKNKYINQYKEKKDEFKTSHEAWLRSLTPEQIAQENKRRKTVLSKGRKRKTKLLKHPDLPKKPKTPYIHFVVDRMGTNVERGPDRIKELAFEWNHLSDEDKEPYKEKFQQSKSKYEKDMKAFKERYVITE